jgi:hypothetical protein
MPRPPKYKEPVRIVFLTEKTKKEKLKDEMKKDGFTNLTSYMNAIIEKVIG